MKSTGKSILGMLSCLVLTSCGSNKTYQVSNLNQRSDCVSYGIYSASPPGTQASKLKLTLSPNNTFLKRKFLGSCLVLETRGSWDCEAQNMSLRFKEGKRRENCESQWEPVQVKGDKERENLLMNITLNAFEILEEGDGTGSPYWIRYSKP